MDRRTPLPVVVDDRHRRHDPPYELNAGQPVRPWERPERIDALRAGLADVPHRLVQAVPHDDAALLAVHDPGLVAFIDEGHARWREAGGPAVMIPDTFRSPRWASGARHGTAPLGAPGSWCFDTATPVVAGSAAAARAAVDVALTAADLLRDGAPIAYALCRPPGHHSGPDYYGGFCLFNNVAVAARSLTDGGRVAILDIDFHHGNGTQDVFWRDSDVLYASLHGDPGYAFPYFTGFGDEVGEGPGRGSTVNVALGRDTDDEVYLRALTAVCERIEAWAPATLIVSLGFDTAAADPIGAFALSTSGFHRIGRTIAALDRPLLLVQEGGYDLDGLGTDLASFLSGIR